MRITPLLSNGTQVNTLSDVYIRSAEPATFTKDERGHKTFITYMADTQDGDRVEVTLNRADIIQLYADMINDPDLSYAQRQVAEKRQP